MWRFKPSKFKNAAPKVPKKPEGWVTDISVGSISSSGNGIQASASFAAFNIDGGGGGTLGILRLDDTGSKRNNLPQLNAHADFVTSFDFCPYDDGILATGSLDHHVKLWRIPYTESKQEIPGNPMVDLLLEDAVEAVSFHPVADCLLATADAKKINLWDVNSEKTVYETCHEDVVQSLSWKPDGQLLATVGRDKKLQIWDPRDPVQSQSTASHDNNRDARVLWLGNSHQILTSGFGSGRQREVFVRDVRSIDEPIFTYTGESSLGVLIPLYDPDTKMLFLVAKADTAVSFWEVLEKDPFVQEVSKYIGNVQAKGAALVPKRGLAVMEGEVNRILILASDCISPLSYIVPRKTYRDFHADLFPDTVAPEPTVTLPQWINNEDVMPSTISLNPSLRGNKPHFKFNHELGSGPQNKLPATKTEIFVEKLDNRPCEENNLINQTKTETVFVGNANAELSPKPPLAPKPASPGIARRTCNQNEQNISTDNKPKNLTPRQSPSPQRPTISFGIRATKFRHLNGAVLPNETHVSDIKSLTRTVPSESNGFEANREFAALPLGPAGSLIAIIPLNTRGRAKSLADIPGVVCGTKCLDFTWDPFNLHRLVTACDTGDIQIWDLDKYDVLEKVTEPAFILKAVCDKASIVKFHPCARDVLCSAGGDWIVRVWDLHAQELKYTLEGHNDQILALAWNPDGQYLATVSKDLKLRVYDPRLSSKPIKEGQGPEGIRGARIVWVLKGTHIVVSGFNKVSERQLYLYDLGNIENPIGNFGLDVSPATLIPSYDEDSSTLFLTGKGDSTVYAFEVATDSPHFFPLSHYKCSGPHQALSFLPKIVCNVREVEFARALRLTTTTLETLSFYVPRLRAEYFQDDIFPDTRVTWESDVTAAEWFSGVNKPSRFISLKPSDMNSLSEAPAPVKSSPAQKPPSEDSLPIVFEGDVVLKGSLAFMQGSKEKEQQIVQSMMSRCQLQTNSLPQDAFDGVDPEEWEEEEREHARRNQ